MENSDLQALNSNEAPESDKKEAANKRTKKGFGIIGMGTLVLVTGCITTMLLPGSHPLYHYILYIPTSIGASMVLYGFYCVFE